MRLACYTYRDRNVVGIGGFKKYFGLWFFQGALLEGASGRLVNPRKARRKRGDNGGGSRQRRSSP